MDDADREVGTGHHAAPRAVNALHLIDVLAGVQRQPIVFERLSASAASAVIHGCDGARTWRVSSGWGIAGALYELGSGATHRTGRFNCSTVGVAQLVELLVVVQAVGGSSPLAHPPRNPCKSFGFTTSDQPAFWQSVHQLSINLLSAVRDRNL